LRGREDDREGEEQNSFHAAENKGTI
jgi:hypothetical protein